MTAAADRVRADTVFDHPGVLYHDDHEYLHATSSFVRTAVAADDAVLVAVPTPRLALLHAALTDLAAEVTFTDLAVAGRNPGRIIPGLMLAFAAQHAGRRIGIVGEPVWPSRSHIEYPACAMHEALVNAVFAGRDATILCLYDAANLHPQRLHDAWLTHPVIINSGERQPSPRYADPFDAAARFNQPLPDIPAHAARLSFSNTTELPAVRDFITRHATTANLPAERVEDLVAAANELVENTIVHTHAAGTIAIWHEDGHLACQTDDQGFLDNPLAGRIPPAPNTEGGRGLLLANYLCDLVRVHVKPTGTSIRLHMRP